MIVVIRLDVTDEQRRTLRQARGRSGLATRKDVTAEVLRLWDQLLADATRGVELERPSRPAPLPEPDPELPEGERCGEGPPEGWEGPQVSCELPRGHRGQHRAGVDQGTATWYPSGRVWME